MARAPQTAPTPLESPAVRRSRMLSEILSQTREAPQIQSGGELAARLLAQGVAQFGANRAEREVGEEQQTRLRQQTEGGLSTLGRLLGNPEMPVPTPSAPAIADAAPATGVAIAPIQGSTPPPAMPTVMPDDAATALLGQTPAPAPQAPMPQAAPPAPAPRNPLGPTPGEAAYITRALQSGNPDLIAEGQAMLAQIEQRMIAPPEFEISMVNGVPFRVDPNTGQTVELFQNGIPQSAQVQDEFNPQGTRAGTFGQRDPFGRLNLIERPPEGFEADGGRLRPIAGGPQDPTTGRNQITIERELRQDFDRATEEYRSVRQSAATVEASLALGTGIGDIGGIFATMKMFDPTSTVREGEFATASNSSGVPEYLRNAYNRVIDGQRLTPEQRAEFVQVARSQLSTYETGYQRRVQDFTRLGESYGLDVQNILGSAAPQREESQAAPAPRRERQTQVPAAPQRQQAAPRPNGVRRRYNPNTGRLE